MAEPGKKISVLPILSDPDNADWIEVLDNSEANPSLKNKKLNLYNLQQFINALPPDSIDGRAPAGEDILAARVLVMVGYEVFHFDPTNEDHYGLVVGVSIAARTTGQTVTFVKSGQYNSSAELSGTQIGAIYYADSDGKLTTVTPAEGIYQEIAFGTESDGVYVNLGQPRLVSEMAGDMSFDGEREIKAVPKVGDIPGGSTISQFLENAFYPYLNATITLNAFPLQIVGTSYSPTVSGVITPKDDTITQRRVLIDGVSVNNPSGNNVSYAAPSFTVAFGNNKLYQIEADVSNDGSPITVESPERTVEGIYPYLWGSSDDPNLTGGALYTNLNKLVQKEGTKSITFNGTNKYFYFGFDAAYGDLSEIKDQNGFPLGGMLASLSAKSVTALGWTHGYKFYRTELTTINNGTYQFIT